MKSFTNRYNRLPLLDEVPIEVILQNPLPGFTCSGAVIHIVNSCTPLEVFNPVIGLILVDVVDLWKMFGVWNECLGNNNMDVEVCGFMVFGQMIKQIPSTGFLRYYDFTWFDSETMNISNLLRKTTKPAKVTYFIKTCIIINDTIFCNNNRFPNLFNHTANLYANIQK